MTNATITNVTFEFDNANDADAANEFFANEYDCTLSGKYLTIDALPTFEIETIENDLREINIVVNTTYF